MKDILLRPHHGMCIRFFEGKGYSDEFTAHMEVTMEKLQEKDCRIVLVEKEDEICQKCPNFLEDGCRTKEKVKRYDRNVMELTGLQAGEKMTFSQLQEQITAKITGPRKMGDICGDCVWAHICHG